MASPCETEWWTGDTLIGVKVDIPEELREPLAPRKRRRWPWVIGVAALLVAVWLNAAASRIFQARDLALSGVGRLETVRQDVNIDAVADGELTADLEAAAEDFETAQSEVRSWLVSPLRLMPWVGTQIRSADALSGSAARVATALAVASADVEALATVAAETDRVGVAREALAIVQRTKQSFADLDLGPAGGLTRSLADARIRFTAELGEASDLLDEVEVAAAGLAEFLEGPTTYLLLAANNSEMRAGSGSYLQAGTVEITNGRIDVRRLRPAGEILLEPGSVEILDDDLAQRWGWLDIASDWRNLSASPRFAANAELAASMWEELEDETVDGVIVLDPVALAAVLAATGPVDLDGRIIDDSSVVRELLFDQYWEDDVEVRRDRLQDVSTATLQAIDRTDIDLVTLAKRMQDAAAGRHLLAWSRQPVQQQAWQSVGIDGAMDPDSLMVSVLNRGANKLDSFLTVAAVLESERGEQGRTVTVEVRLDNTAQSAFPDYVLGPALALGNEPGTYVGILSVNVPAAAVRPRFAGVESLVASGSDGSGQVVAMWVEIPPGEQLVHELVFELPDSSPTIRIEPSARVPGVIWSAAGANWIDAADALVDLSAGTVSGEVLERAIEPIVFEPDPISNPVAPIPFMRVDGDVETTIVVSWPAVQVGRGVDVWERRDGADWMQVGADITDRELWLTERAREAEYCYRTALATAPERFSVSECIVVPAALGFMRFPGDPDDYFSASDFVGSGDLDVRVLVAPDRWTPEFWQMFAGQYDSNPNDRSWRFGIDIFTALVGNFSEDGFVDLGTNQEIPVSFADGRRKWVRMTIEPTEGRLRFWTSNGGSVWRLLGGALEFEPIEGLHDSVGPVYVGTDRPGSDNPFSGDLYYLEIRDGVNGPVIANLDFRTPDQLDTASGRWTDDHGNVFRPHGSGWEYVPPEAEDGGGG